MQEGVVRIRETLVDRIESIAATEPSRPTDLPPLYLTAPAPARPGWRRPMTAMPGWTTPEHCARAVQEWRKSRLAEHIRHDRRHPGWDAIDWQAPASQGVGSVKRAALFRSQW